MVTFLFSPWSLLMHLTKSELMVLLFLVSLIVESRRKPIQRQRDTFTSNDNCEQPAPRTNWLIMVLRKIVPFPWTGGSIKKPRVNALTDPGRFVALGWRWLKCTNVDLINLNKLFDNFGQVLFNYRRFVWRATANFRALDLKLISDHFYFCRNAIFRSSGSCMLYIGGGNVPWWPLAAVLIFIWWECFSLSAAAIRRAGGIGR